MLKRLFWILIIAGLPACRIKRRKCRLTNEPCACASALKNHVYHLRVTGIECRQCVADVLKIFDVIGELSNVVCRCPHKQYEQAQFSCTFTKKLTAKVVADLQERLTQENFSIETLCGRFTGTVTEENMRQHFQPQELNQPVQLLADQQMLQVLAQYGAAKSATPVSVIGTWRPADQTLHVEALEFD